MDIFQPSTERNYPFVKFRNKRTPVLRSGETGADYYEDFYLPLNGSHNSEQAIMNCEKDGKVILGVGNLNKNNHKHLAQYLQARLSTNAAIAEMTTLDKKVDELKDKSEKPRK
jgi:hypothetical protein